MPRLREATGFALLIAGLLDTLLPVILGTPLIIAGIAVLGTKHPRIQPSATRLDR